jgi:hypothetical protein
LTKAETPDKGNQIRFYAGHPSPLSLLGHPSGNGERAFSARVHPLNVSLKTIPFRSTI